MTASYPATRVFKVFETDEVVSGGGATFAADQQLADIVLDLYVLGTLAGTERLRALIYTDSALAKLYATSAWSALADASVDTSSGAWLGQLRFAFSPAVHLDAGALYYIAFEIDSYTRSGETLYIAAAYDWPLSINTNTGAASAAYGLAMAPYGYRGVRY